MGKIDILNLVKKDKVYNFINEGEEVEALIQRIRGKVFTNGIVNHRMTTLLITLQNLIEDGITDRYYHSGRLLIGEDGEAVGF